MSESTNEELTYPLPILTKVFLERTFHLINTIEDVSPLRDALLYQSSIEVLSPSCIKEKEKDNDSVFMDVISNKLVLQASVFDLLSYLLAEKLITADAFATFLKYRTLKKHLFQVDSILENLPHITLEAFAQLFENDCLETVKFLQASNTGVLKFAHGLDYLTDYVESLKEEIHNLEDSLDTLGNLQLNLNTNLYTFYTGAYCEV